MGLGRGAFAALVGVVLLGCASAQGSTQSLGKAGGYKYVVAKQGGVQGSDGPQVLCGAARQPTGGGGTISGKPKQGRLVSTFPDGDAHSWQTIAAVQASGNRTVKSFAVCTRAEVTYPDQTSAVPAGTLVGTGAVCTAGQVPTGGGEFISGAGALVSSDPVRVPPVTGDFVGWESFVENRGASLTSATFYTACADPPFAYRVKDDLVDADKAVEIVARCRKHEHVVGGGMADNLIDPGSGYIHASRPWDSGDSDKVPDDGWLARLQNLSDEQHAAAAWGVCDKE